MSIWLLVVLLPALVQSCGEGVPRFPPCKSPDYIIEECVIPGTNGTTRKQCTKHVPYTIYERWEFWFGILFSIGLMVTCIITWRCIRHCQWYTELKNSIRHEKNRVCARLCVKYCCPCKTCVKCCEPYTRPTVTELQAQRDAGADVSLSGHMQNSSAHHAHHHPHHHAHHHHHLHIDRRRSECVHPQSPDQEAHEPTSHHHQHTVKNSEYKDKTLEEVCVDGIHIT